MRLRLTVLLTGLVIVAPVGAQDTSDRFGDILKAILLPRSTEELRNAGVPEDEIRIAIEEAIRRRVPASDSKEMMDEATRAAREKGPVDHFGAFVRAQLAAGVRGRELAAAIHAEHARRGIGKGNVLEEKRDKSGRGAKDTTLRKGGSRER